MGRVDGARLPSIKALFEVVLIMEHTVVLCNSKTVVSVAILLSTNCSKCWIITRCNVCHNVVFFLLYCYLFLH